MKILFYSKRCEFSKKILIYLDKNNIKEQFKLIEHDGITEDNTYENTQARARTMILMNLANKYSGLVLGTGDLSEMALGWCTYNGDQMSMYGINVGIPKTLVQFMIYNYAVHKFNEDVRGTLLSIVDTPITPELTSNQKTEDTIGKYEVNDFIVHRVLRYGDTEDRISWLLPKVFEINAEASSIYATNFFKRFYFVLSFFLYSRRIGSFKNRTSGSYYKSRKFGYSNFYG